jgi:chromosome segregation ATPase
MDRDGLARAHARLAEARTERPKRVELEAALERAEEALSSLAQTAAELEAAVPERLGSALEEGMRAEVLPVARHIAEVRGLTGQLVRRLESLQGEIAAERRERLEDLALLVDLIGSGWRGVERRLDRAERILDRIERGLEERPGAALYRIDGLPG